MAMIMDMFNRHGYDRGYDEEHLVTVFSQPPEFHVFLRGGRVVLRGVPNCAVPETAQYFAW